MKEKKRNETIWCQIKESRWWATFCSVTREVRRGRVSQIRQPRSGLLFLIKDVQTPSPPPRKSVINKTYYVRYFLWFMVRSRDTMFILKNNRPKRTILFGVRSKKNRASPRLFWKSDERSRTRDKTNVASSYATMSTETITLDRNTYKLFIASLLRFRSLETGGKERENTKKTTIHSS